MGYIEDGLKQERNACSRQIDYLNDKIKKYERAYESLQKFKQAVKRSESDFENANTGRKKILSDLNSITKNCRTAEKYQSGMGNTLTGVGMKVVGAAFDGMCLSINVKMAEYKALIKACEVDRGVLQTQRDSLDMQIALAEMV